MKRNSWSARLVCALTASVALASCSGDGSNRADAKPGRTSAAPTVSAAVPTGVDNGIPECKKPKEVDFPEWIPDDLPLPEGAYAYKNLAPLGGYKRALFVLEQGTRQFIKLVLREWPKAGYVLGRGDAEPGEVEDDFRKPPAVGAFKANDVYCDPGYTVMYLIWAEDGPKGFDVAPTPSGSPLKSK